MHQNHTCQNYKGPSILCASYNVGRHEPGLKRLENTPGNYSSTSAKWNLIINMRSESSSWVVKFIYFLSIIINETYKCLKKQAGFLAPKGVSRSSHIMNSISHFIKPWWRHSKMRNAAFVQLPTRYQVVSSSMVQASRPLRRGRRLQAVNPCESVTTACSQTTSRHTQRR